MCFTNCDFLYSNSRNRPITKIKTKAELKLLPPSTKTEAIDKKFVCDDCGYTTNRRNNLTNHERESCKVRRKNGLYGPGTERCKYCSKNMTHNALRAHLLNSIRTIKKNAIPKEHTTVTLNELTDYLNEIKK